MRGRAAVILLVVAVLGMVSGCGGSSTKSAPTVGSPTPKRQATVDTAIKVYGDCTTPSVEPTKIVLACVDEGELIVGLQWTSWTATSAVGVGTFEYNDCTPDCANGHFHNVPGITFVLSNPVARSGGLVVWSQMQAVPGLPNGFRAVQPLPTRPV